MVPILSDLPILILADEPAIHEQIRAAICTPTPGPGTASGPPDGTSGGRCDSAYRLEQALELVQAGIDAARPYALAFVSGRMSPTWDGADIAHRLWRLDHRLELVLCVPISVTSWDGLIARIGETAQLTLVEEPVRHGAQLRQVIRTLTEKWRIGRANEYLEDNLADGYLADEGRTEEHPREESRVDELERAIATRTVELEATHSQLCQEIAARARVEDELRRAQRLHALGRMAAGLGHEINNPLSFVVQGIEAAQLELEELAESYDPDPLIDSCLGDIDRLLETALVGADRIGRIVRNIKLVAHPVDTTAESADIRAALELAVDMIRPNIDPHITIVSDLEDVPQVWCKRVELEQVFMNLLQNAGHALASTPAPGAEIRIGLRHRGDAVLIAIADTGTGIPKHHLQTIFDPFFTTKPAGQGTGLGLSVCHAIIGGIGGQIHVESELGKGTVFTVELPGLDVGGKRLDTNTQVENLVVPEIVAPRKPQVLVVDDESLIRRVVKHALAEYDITEAADGQEALTQCLTRSFDVILCDIMMPNLNGMQFYERMAELMPGSEDDIIFFTAGTQLDEVREFLDQVTNDCLEKPIERRRLQQYVADTIQRRRTQL